MQDVIAATGRYGLTQIISTTGSMIVALLALGAAIAAWRTKERIEGAHQQFVANLDRRVMENRATMDKLTPDVQELRTLVAAQVESTKNLGRNVDRLFELIKDTHKDIAAVNASLHRLVEVILTGHGQRPDHQ